MTDKKSWNVNAKKVLASFLVIVISLLIGTSFVNLVSGEPGGVNIVSNFTEQPNATPATSLTTAGGTFTTLVLNGSFQNPRWKAYVGNISGVLTLDNTGGYTIFNWNLSTITGEIYVTRNSTINWPSINCTTQAKIAAEQQFLSMNDSSVDSINKTFNYTIHKSFYVSTTNIPQSTCRSLATYVNDARQTMNINAVFQEVLLADTNTNIIYTTLIEDNTIGFDSGRYDFQMIVPEDETKTTPTTYYFFAELT
jgi:hypothetical protein